MSVIWVVLIVDDDFVVFEIMCILLEGKDGFEVFCVFGLYGVWYLMM